MDKRAAEANPAARVRLHDTPHFRRDYLETRRNVDPYTLYHRPAARFVADFIGHGVFTPARIVAQGVPEDGHCNCIVRTPLGDLTDVAECPMPEAYPDGECEVLLRADDIVHDDAAPVKARIEQRAAQGPVVHTVLGELQDLRECPLADSYPRGECDVLLRADDIVHDDSSPVKACIERKAFRGSEFLYTLRLPGGEQLMAHVPSHHDHQVGEWIGIRAAVDHVVTFDRQAGAGHGFTPAQPT